MGRFTGVLTSFLFCSVLAAQSNLATIHGVITDPRENAVPNADVRARSGETGAVRAAKTGQNGEFEMPGLSPGRYDIEVQAAGFATAKHEMRLEVGQNVRLHLGLTIG